MDHLRRYDLTVGARYHGVALALQAERIGLTITVDSRTKELCEQTGVPSVAAEDLRGPVTRKTLHDRVKRFDGAAYDELRAARAATYVDFLTGNGLPVAPFLLGLARRSPAMQVPVPA
jgi:polysaccharide pyruvyl transferase WcaK-like protein